MKRRSLTERFNGGPECSAGSVALVLGMALSSVGNETRRRALCATSGGASLERSVSPHYSRLAADTARLAQIGRQA